MRPLSSITSDCVVWTTNDALANAMNISLTQLRRDAAVFKELELIRQEETQQRYKRFDQRDSEIMSLFRQLVKERGRTQAIQSIHQIIEGFTIMNTTDKKAVEQAKAAQNGSAGKQKRTTRSTENAEQGLNNVQAKLNDAREKVRQSTKNYIFGAGISDALEDIANGNFGDLDNEIFEALDDFIGGIDNGRLALETKETEPKKMLPASLDCANSENSGN